MPAKALKVPFIINVLRAGFETALVLLSIIYLLSKDTLTLWCQLRIEMASKPNKLRSYFN